MAVIGPECTGKSELSKFLAGHFKTEWVPEYAREYIDKLSRPYEEDDLIKIAEGQLEKENEHAIMANRLLICDTNLYVIKVWSEYKYGRTKPFILDAIASTRYDLYLLTYIDIPWEEDPQREHPMKREELFNIYLNEMQRQSVPFVVIRGAREQRRTDAIKAIQTIL